MPILKGVSSCISPELLKVLAEMGHGDQIGLPLHDHISFCSHCGCELPCCFRGKPLSCRCNSSWRYFLSRSILPIGHDIPRILSGICKLFPLDQYVEKPVRVLLPIVFISMESLIYRHSWWLRWSAIRIWNSPSSTSTSRSCLRLRDETYILVAYDFNG